LGNIGLFKIILLFLQPEKQLLLSCFASGDYIIQSMTVLLYERLTGEKAH
jgi:hypothetical protein